MFNDCPKLIIFCVFVTGWAALGNKLFVYEDANHNGAHETIEYTNGCRDFEEAWRNRISSLNSFGRCVALYSQPGCKGNVRYFLKNSPWHENLKGFSFNDEAASFEPCSLSEEFICWYCDKPLARGSVEYTFWSKLFALYSDAKSAEFESSVNKSQNGYISWKFIYEPGDKDVPEKNGDQYRYLLESQIDQIRSLQSTNPSTLALNNSFTLESVKELIKRAEDVLSARKKANEKIPKDWNIKLFVVQTAIIQLWTEMVDSLNKIYEEWKTREILGSTASSGSRPKPSVTNTGVKNSLSSGATNDVRIVSDPPSGTCRPLLSESLTLKCDHGEKKNIPCGRYAPTGTIARAKCKASHHVVGNVQNETRCGGDGRWSPLLLKCVPDCGVQSSNAGSTLIRQGSDTVIGEYPWAAALYINENDTFVFNCGGSIISPHIILTAAHCVYEADNTLRSPNTMRVAVGKYHSSFSKMDIHEQIMEVREITPVRAYTGAVNHFERDIATIELKESIVFSQIVLPVCVDWTSEGELSNGMIGTVVGWGIDETNATSKTLQSANLLYMDYETCRDKADSNFRPYVTYDKFCAGLNNGTTVARGDSGSGITFVRNSHHYLHGLVSNKPQNSTEFALYTNINEHKSWLNSIVKAAYRRREEI